MRIEELRKYMADKDTPVVEAMQLIDVNTKGILFVTDGQGKLQGTVTDGDIRRWLIKTGNLKAPIELLMNKNPRFLYMTDTKRAQEQMKKYKIHALPILTPDNEICDIVYDDDRLTEGTLARKSLADVPVIIMAGGKGTRLYPYTKILPKPLIPIGDIPIMERIMLRFKEYGVSHFWATVNYRKNMIKSYFSDAVNDCDITYVEEDKPLGTAGSLQLIKEKFERPVIVTNCDVLIQTNYEELYKYHQESGNEITVVSALKNIVVPYGVICAKENGTIESMEEKPKLSYFINTGMYVLNPEALKMVPKDTFFHMPQLVEMLMRKGKKVGMYPISEDSFLDMGEFEEMRRMEEKLDLKTE